MRTMLARPSHNHNCRLIREGIRSTHALYGRLDLALITGWDSVDAGRELVPLLDEELTVAPSAGAGSVLRTPGSDHVRVGSAAGNAQPHYPARTLRSFVPSCRSSPMMIHTWDLLPHSSRDVDQ
jgi:hypothetical protein